MFLAIYAGGLVACVLCYAMGLRHGRQELRGTIVTPDGRDASASS